jgi:hypothetical protein
MKLSDWPLYPRFLVVVVLIVIGQAAILSPAWWSLPPFAATMSVMTGGLTICTAVVVALGRRARVALALLRRVSSLAQGWK